MTKELSEEDFQSAAEMLRIPINLIKAVTQVESSGSGFLKDGRPKILFERHHFHRLTKGRWSSAHPSISNKKPGGYTKNDEWVRFNLAASLDRDSAIQASSWGLFQIMGFNYNECGYDSPLDFMGDMCSGEGAHLKAFVNFIEKKGIGEHLRNRKFGEFAKYYNGPNYHRNSYDIKIKNAFHLLEKESSNIAGASIIDVQSRLIRAGINPGKADGIMGPRTIAAIREFQRKNGLNVTGKISNDFLVSLRAFTK